MKNYIQPAQLDDIYLAVMRAKSLTAILQAEYLGTIDAPKDFVWNYRSIQTLADTALHFSYDAVQALEKLLITDAECV